MSNSPFIFWLLLVLMSSSCQTSLQSLSTRKLDYKDISIQQVDSKFFTARSKISISDGSKKVNAIVNFRIGKDSLLWFSIQNSMGIEGARGIINKDSITIMDRMNRNYFVMDYKELEEKFHVKCDYNILESIVLGNMPSDIHSAEAIFKQGKQFRIRHRLGELIMTNMVGRETKKIERVELQNTFSGDNLVVEYGKFENMNGGLFPTRALIKINYKSKEQDVPFSTSFDLDYQKIETNEKKLRFPFNIPAKYAKKV